MKEKKGIKKIYKRESGFTLIELLVVIGIIAVLATIGTISFGNAASKSRDAKRQADLKTMASGLQIYNTRKGVFPASINETVPLTTWAGFLGLLGVSGATPPRAGEDYCYFARSGGAQSLNAFLLVSSDFENALPSDAFTDITNAGNTGLFDTGSGDNTNGFADDFVVDSTNRNGPSAANLCKGKTTVTADPNCLAADADPTGDGNDFCVKGSSTALF